MIEKKTLIFCYSFDQIFLHRRKESHAQIWDLRGQSHRLPPPSTEPEGEEASQPTASTAHWSNWASLICNAYNQVTKRTGWIRCNVKGPESIADHMYRMGMMSLIAGDVGVNTDR